MVTTMNVSTPSATDNQDGNNQPSFVLDSVDPLFRYGKRVKFTTRISAALIHELMLTDKIRVDYDQQRGEKIGIAPDGTETRTPMLDTKRVDEIADKILNESLYGGSLTWNLRPTRWWQATTSTTAGCTSRAEYPQGLTRTIAIRESSKRWPEQSNLACPSTRTGTSSPWSSSNWI